MRREYSSTPLTLQELSAEPFHQFEKWFNQALAQESQEPNAMILSTCSKSGVPSSRVVLLKSFEEKKFLFFTNYDSKKGQEIVENPHVSLLFFWPNSMREVRVEGRAVKSPQSISKEYFYTRPRESQASSSLSRQSKILDTPQVFEELVNTLVTSNKEIPYPDNWGGIYVEPYQFEFWQGGVGRMHSRFCYKKEELSSKKWKIFALYP